MFFVLYDRFLKSIGEPYILESWNRIQRATDFDEIKLVGAEIPQSANPFLIVVNDKKGNQLFSGLASTPIINDKTKKTTITLKDYLTLFNSDIVVDWSLFSGTTVAELIDFIFTAWQSQIQVGLQSVFCDTSKINDKLLDREIYAFAGRENIFVYDWINNALNYYDLYSEAIFDLKTNTLTFKFKKANQNALQIKLSDFGITAIEKSFGDYNRATIYSADFEKKQEWALTESNNVVKLPTESNLVYPAKNKNFIAKETTQKTTNENGETIEITSDGVNEAVYEAVMGLAQNRYQENIDLNAQQHKSIVDLTTVDFSYIINVYTNEGAYKALPIGEIETDNTGKHIVRLGHRIQELTQEL